MGLTGCVTTGGQPFAVVDNLSQTVDNLSRTVKNTFASDDPCSDNARNIGTAVGVGVGLLVATQLDQNLGKVAAVVGAGWIGNLIGADIDRKRCELSKIAKQNNLAVEFQPLEVGAQESNAQAFSMNLRDTLGDQAQFERNSDRLTPRAKKYFQQIAAQYAQQAAPPANASAEEKKAWQARMAQRKLLLIGHTDDTGSSAINATLSEKRARAVANLLASNGVPRQQMYFQGAGETYPLVSNATEEGQAQNRRVEFIEVYGDEALAYYLDNRRANYALYRPATQVDASAATSTAKLPKKSSRPSPPQRTAKNTASPTVKSTVPSAAQTGQKSAASTVAATSKPALVATTPPAKPVVSNTATKPVLDFGGEPIKANTRMVDLGVAAAPKSGFNLISSAYASTGDMFIARCDQDRPRSTGTVKALASGKAYRTHEHLKGLHGSSWAQMLNGHLVVLHKVAVLRDGSAPHSPEVKLYANYRPQQKNAKPLWSGRPQVNVYQGGNGLLYRMFLGGTNPSAGVQCMDVLFPQGGDAQAKDGKLIYGPTSQLYAADFKPDMQ